MKRAKSDNNGKILDEMYKSVVEKLQTEGDAWRKEAKENFPQAFEAWEKDIQALKAAITPKQGRNYHR